MDVHFLYQFSKSAKFVTSRAKILDNSTYRINRYQYELVEQSFHGKAFCGFFAINSSLEATGSISIRGGAARRGASPGSPINRASSDPQKRDDVVKGEGRSRRGAKAAL